MTRIERLEDIGRCGSETTDNTLDRPSWAAQQLLDDDEYHAAYRELFERFLGSVKFTKGRSYRNHWPLSAGEAERPPVLILGRATMRDWGKVIDASDFDAGAAIDVASRQNMDWYKSESPFWRVTRKTVRKLPCEFTDGRDGNAALAWSELFKIARTNNPIKSERNHQKDFGLAEILRREIQVLQPRLVVAMTQPWSSSERRVKREWFDDILGPCDEVYSPAESFAPFATFVSDVPCVVGCHPRGHTEDRYAADVCATLERFVR